MAKYIGPVKEEVPQTLEFTHEEVMYLSKLLNICDRDLRAYHKCTKRECEINLEIWKVIDEASRG